jgi:uncharacterized protein (TIGR02996 family)
MTLDEHLDQIRKNHEDAGAYLVFSDWLQEQADVPHGKEWGQLIILHHRLEQQPGNSAIAGEADALMKKHGWTLPSKLGNKPENLRLEWRWGFLRHVRIFDQFGDIKIGEIASWIHGLPMGGLLETFYVFYDGRYTDQSLDGHVKELLPKSADIRVVAPVALADRKKGPEPKETLWLQVDEKVPANIDKYGQLRMLELGDVTKLPKELGALPIERLDIDYCYRLRSIPDDVWGIESLGYMSMYDCSGLGLHMGQVNNLLSGFIRARTPKEQRIVEAALMQGKQPRKATVEQLLLALDNNVKKVREAAVQLLAERVANPLDEKPLEQGSVLVVLGSTNVDKKSLKARVEALGVKVATKVSDKTTHVLVGERPKGKHIGLKGPVWFCEKHLIVAISDDAAEAGDGKQSAALDTEALSKALRSKQDRSIVSAVETLQNHATIPAELLPELFCVLQDTELSKKGKGRAQAKKLFSAYAPEIVQQALAKHFKTSVLLAGETKRSSRLRALHKMAGEQLDVVRIAKLFVQDHRCGHGYLLGREPELRRWALEQLLEGADKTRLKIAGFELDELPDLSHLSNLKHIDASGNHLWSFPEQVPTDIESLELSGNYLRSLPKSLAQYEKLHTLDLSYNRFQSFPKGVTTLPALRELHLSSETWGETRITSIPKEIAARQARSAAHR